VGAFADLDYEACWPRRPGVRLAGPADEWDAIALNYTSGTTGDPKGVVYHHRGAAMNAMSNILEWDMPKHPSTCGRCPCSTATAGASRGRSPRAQA
jgi:fatty-acyl-CoA synthase